MKGYLASQAELNKQYEHKRKISPTQYIEAIATALQPGVPTTSMMANTRYTTMHKHQVK
jgi:hypothetical protein